MRAAAEFYRILQGRSDPDELASILVKVEEMEDRDISAGRFDLAGIAALSRGEFRVAHDQWMQVVGLSELNTPYCLPRTANAAVLAGDAVAARATLAQLDALGTRGRAVDADRTVIRAGIAAIEGDQAAAVIGYRNAMAAWRDLALPWDEALTALSAVIRLGMGAPGVPDWVDTARATFRRLEAAPMLVLLETAAATAAS